MLWAKIVVVQQRLHDAGQNRVLQMVWYDPATNMNIEDVAEDDQAFFLEPTAPDFF